MRPPRDLDIPKSSIGFPKVPNKSLTSGTFTSLPSVAFRRRNFRSHPVYYGHHLDRYGAASSLKRFGIEEADKSWET
jgi:hypothetical protein